MQKPAYPYVKRALVLLAMIAAAIVLTAFACVIATACSSRLVHARSDQELPVSKRVDDFRDRLADRVGV